MLKDLKEMLLSDEIFFSDNPDDNLNDREVISESIQYLEESIQKLETSRYLLTECI